MRLVGLLVGFTLAFAAAAGAADSDWDRLRWMRDTLNQPSDEKRRRLPLLIEQLRSPNLDFSTTAAEIIGRYPTDASLAIPALIARLDEPNGEAGAIYSDALARLGEAALAPLYQAVMNGHSLVRSRACDALHRLRPADFGAECRYAPAMPADLAARSPLLGPALEQARALLERYGDTFYALGYYLDAEGRAHTLSPTTSALTPAAIAADLAQQLAPLKPTAAHTLLLEDHPDLQLIRLHFTANPATCTTWLLHYRFDARGRVGLGETVASSCR